MPRDSAAADRPASYLVGTAAAFPLFFRDRTKPINQLPFSPSAKFPKSGSSCESRASSRLPRSEAGIRSPIHGVTRTSPPRILPVNALTIFAGPRLKTGSAKIWVRRNRRGRIHLDLDPARLVDVAVLRLRTALSSITRCLKRIQPCGRYGSRPAHLLE